MDRSLASLGELLLFGLVCMGLGFAFLALMAPALAKSHALFSAAPDHLQHLLAQVKQDNKQGVLVLFERNGCNECQKVKDTVLRDPAVQEYYRRYFLSVRLDLSSFAPLTDFKGKMLTRSEFAQAHRVQVAPTFVFYDASGSPVTHFAGPVKDAAEFLQLGCYVAGAIYQTVPFRVYQQSIQ